MKLTDLEQSVRRAAEFTINKKKLVFSAATLFLSGLVLVFVMGLALSFGPWLAQSLYVSAFFISLGLLMSLGVLLIRCYHDEVKNQEIKMVALLIRSWPTLLQVLALFVPLLLGYLVLWISNGLFLLLSEIPIFGVIVSTVLIVIPFLICTLTLLVMIGAVYFVFALSPTFALGAYLQQGQFMELFRDAQQYIFVRLSHFVVGILPLIISLCITGIASAMTLDLCAADVKPLDFVMKWFFMMLPFTLLLAPSVVFFFNMATEAHILIHKTNGEQ